MTLGGRSIRLGEEMNVRGEARSSWAAGLGPKEDDICHLLSGRT